MNPLNPDRMSSKERLAEVTILAHRVVAPLLSDDHFSVDGTLVKAWASMKSFQSKGQGDVRPGRRPWCPARYPCAASIPL